MNLVRELFWYALVVSIVFGTRFLISRSADFIEYGSMFWYVSDVLLVLFVLFSRYNIRKAMAVWPWKGTLLIMLITAGLSALLSSSLGLGVVAWLRLLLLMGAICAARPLLSQRRIFRITLLIIGLLAIDQAFLAIWQFSHQAPIGASFFGESPLSPVDLGSSKIVLAGATLVRAYGLFPHPNVLAAFLVIGFAALLYFFLAADKGLYITGFDKAKSLASNLQAYVKNKLLYMRLGAVTGMFMVLLGLLFTFSRSGWLTSGLVALGFLLWQGRYSLKAAARLLVVLLIMVWGLYYFFSPLISPRLAVSSTEPAVSDRVVYNKIGVDLIGRRPILGVGIGSQVMSSISTGEYAKYGLTNTWQFQPIHNLYLLMASEIGIIGALSFVVFLAIVIRRLWANRADLSAIFALIALCALLVLGLLDHYLWDLQQGKLLLWIVTALAIASDQKPKINN